MRDQVEKLLLEIKPELADLLDDNLNLTEFLDSMDIIFLVEVIERDYNIVVGGTEIIPENFASLPMIIDLIIHKLP